MTKIEQNKEIFENGGTVENLNLTPKISFNHETDRTILVEEPCSGTQTSEQDIPDTVGGTKLSKNVLLTGDPV